MSKTPLFFLDTNIFIYFFQEHPTFFRTVLPIFEALSQKKAKAITSVLTLTELLSLPLPEKNLTQLQSLFLETPGLTILPITTEVAEMAAQIRRKYRFKTPDSLQLATATLHKATVFYSNDQKLATYKEVAIRSLTPQHKDRLTRHIQQRV